MTSDLKTKIVYHLNKFGPQYTKRLYTLYGKGEKVSLNKFRLTLRDLEKQGLISHDVSETYPAWRKI